MPGKFVVGSGAAHLSTIEARDTSGRFRLRLLGPGDASGDAPGPELTAAARRGLAFVMAWGGYALSPVIGDRDPTEPYHFNFHWEVGLPMLPILSARRSGPMDVAVVWNAAGAGNTGFLADFFTTRGGATAP